MGYDFQGIYNLWEQNINLVETTVKHRRNNRFLWCTKSRIGKIIGQNLTREELELIDEVYPKFDHKDYLDGKLQPVFWFRIE
jgi:peptide chain release factor 3